MHRLLLVLSCLLTASPAWAGTRWAQQEGDVSYKVVHKFHEVEGVSHALEVTAVLDGDVLKVMARAPVNSFNSGNANRDAHTLEVVEAGKFPMVTVRAMMAKFTLPAPGPAQDFTIPGEVEFHGIKVRVPVTAHIQAVDAQNITVAFEFTDSLDAHHVERPELLFVKVDDAMRVAGHAKLRPQADAPKP